MKLLAPILLSALVMTTALSQEHTKDSHAILPLDTKKAACIPNIDHSLDIHGYHKLLLKDGHDTSALLEDPRINRRHLKDIYTATQFYPAWVKIGKRNSDLKTEYFMLDGVNSVARQKGRTISINIDQWGKFGSSMRVGVIFHELAHSLGGMLSQIDNSKLWEDIDGGWRRISSRPNGGIFEGKPKKGSAYVSDYSMRNPAEDFAESVSSYRVKPRALMAASMKKYNFIKKHVFLGQEFLDDSTCDKSVIDIVDINEYEDFLIEKFIARPNYFKSTYDYFLRRKKHLGRNYRDLEIYFLKTSALLYMGRIGRRGKLTSEDFLKRHSLRVYLNHSEDIRVIKTDYAQELIHKLRR